MPLTFLGGYLGAGKTTLLNRLLERTERRIAVMVNDVGEINVDERLVRRRSSNSVELTGGCVCCSLADGFGAAFDALRARPEPPDQVVIELSGLAEPERLRPWGRSAGFRLDGVIVLADLTSIADQLETPGLGAAISGQLRSADVVVATKADLLDADAVAAGRARITEELVGPVPVLDGLDPVAVAGLLELGGRDPRGETVVPPGSLFDAHSVTHVEPGPLDEAGVRALLAEHGDRLVRAKGIVDAPDGGRLLVQQVGRRVEVEPVPAAEWSQATGLVLISLG